MTSLLLRHAGHPGALAKHRSVPEVALDPPRLLHPAADTTRLGTAQLLAIAEGLAVSIPSWLGRSRPARRTWDLMVESENFEAWVITWPPGGAIELHDHGHSAGAVIVASGELVETELVGTDRRFETRTTVLPAGASVTFGAGHVHDVANRGDFPATSVHVYAPRLTAMTYYEVTDERVEPGRTVRYHLGAVIP